MPWETATESSQMSRQSTQMGSIITGDIWISSNPHASVCRQMLRYQVVCATFPYNRTELSWLSASRIVIFHSINAWGLHSIHTGPVLWRNILPVHLRGSSTICCVWWEVCLCVREIYKVTRQVPLFVCGWWAGMGHRGYASDNSLLFTFLVFF